MGGGWAAGGRLYLLLGLLRVAMSPKSIRYRPRHIWRAKETSHQHWGQFQIHDSQLFPSMGPIVLFMTLHGQKTCSTKADRLAKPGNATVHGYCTYKCSYIGWDNKI